MSKPNSKFSLVIIHSESKYFLDDKIELLLFGYLVLKVVIDKFLKLFLNLFHMSRQMFFKWNLLLFFLLSFYIFFFFFYIFFHSNFFFSYMFAAAFFLHL